MAREGGGKGVGGGGRGWGRTVNRHQEMHKQNCGVLACVYCKSVMRVLDTVYV